MAVRWGKALADPWLEGKPDRELALEEWKTPTTLKGMNACDDRHSGWVQDNGGAEGALGIVAAAVPVPEECHVGHAVDEAAVDVEALD